MASPMYRLAPHLPLVWTSASSIQVGIDPPIARVENIPDNATPLLHALTEGTPESGLAMLARVHHISDDWVDHLVASLRPALTTTPPVADSRLLEAWSTSTAISAMAGLARASGWELVVPEKIDADTAPTADTVILVADYLVHPHWADQLSRENIHHVPIVFSDQTITVGPLVTPGQSPCLVCVEAHRRDDMVGWLEVSSQLWGKHSPLHTPTNIAMAWSLLLVLMSPGGVAHATPGFTRAAYMPNEKSVSWQAVDFHPSCSCRGLTARH